MKKECVAKKFKEQLTVGEQFSIVNVDEFEWKLVSNNCVISFIFERYDEDACGVYVSHPKSSDLGESLVFLRHIFGAQNFCAHLPFPENFARLFNQYFFDILNGDFSYIVKYKKKGFL